MDRTTSSRRRFLALTAAGSGLSTAGCSGLLGETPSQEGTGGEGATRRTMVVVEPDQERLMEARTRIGREIQEGNLSQREVQEKFQAAQRRILSEAADEAETLVTERGLTVEAVKGSHGSLLVSGPATGLIDLLSHESIRGLFAPARFEELETPTPTSTSTATDG